MLFLKRFITSIILFVLLFLILSFGSLFVGGLIIGVKMAVTARSEHTRVDPETTHLKGEEFGREYAPLIFLASAGIALVTSPALSFGGAFPWCRKSGPPPLP